MVPFALVPMMRVPYCCHGEVCSASGSAQVADAHAQVVMRGVEDIEEELRARRQYAKASGAGEAYESSDDEEGRGGQRVQCAQQ